MQNWHENLVRFLIVIVAAGGVLMWYATFTRIAEDWDAPVAEMEFGRDLRGSIVAGELAADRRVDAIYDRSDPACRDVAACNYFYTPWFAIAMIPFSWIPFPAVFVVWSLMGVSTLVVSIWFLGFPRWWAVGFGVVLSLAAVIAVWYGQPSLLMVGLMAGAAMAAIRGRSVAAGVGFAVLAFKPHLLVAFGAVWLLDIRRWRQVILGFLAATVALVAVSALWLPGSWGIFIRTIVESEPLADASREVTLLSAAQLAFGSETTAAWAAFLVLAGVVLAILVVAGRRTNNDPTSMVSLAIIASLLVAIHSLAYNWLLLVVAFGVLIATDRTSMREIAVPSLSLAGVLLVGFPATDAMLKAVGFAVHLPPIALFVIFVWLAKRLTEPHSATVAAE